ncbi:PIN domain-like protein, partial [Aureobasidium melanogenum]
LLDFNISWLLYLSTESLTPDIEQGRACDKSDLKFDKRSCGPTATAISGASRLPVNFTSCNLDVDTKLMRRPVWIHSLWDILGEGEMKSLAQLSTDHFQKHKRSLRVAIDEAGWRFHNLSDAQVHAIREKVPEANPIEKAILWRVLKLMRMNIQPIFIFDGPSRPWKRGGVAGRVDWKKIDLLRKMLNMLKIPHHRAPAEAEAECARLNELGIVDAVWTDDSDALMFGAKVLIKKHREGRGNTAKKSDTLVRIYRADVIEHKHRINRQGLILFALLSGGDYDTKGLPGCGPMAALEAAQFDNGRLGKILCETPLRQLHCFTESLRDYFRMPGSRSVYVPPGYPRDLHVKNYREPKVSTPEQANDLRGLKNGWYVPIDEPKLRPFLLHIFNFSTKGYLKHILPILLTKELVQTTSDTVDKNLFFELQVVQKRGRDYNADCLERQITFNPRRCTELNLWKQPEDEDWPEGFDPTAPVEAELLEYILVNALGEAEMQRLTQLATQPTRKRKTIEIETEIGIQTSVQSTDGTAKSAPKKQKKDMASGGDTTSSTSSPCTASKPAAKHKPTKRHGKTIERSTEAESTEPEAPTPPVKKGFQSGQDGLSRSASYQSLDSVADTPRRISDVSVSQQTSRNTPRASIEQTSGEALDSQVPPSSQLDREAGSWLSPQPQTLSPRPNAIPTSSSSNRHPPIKAATSQQPSSRSQVVIDLGSDDEDTAPAPISSSITIGHAQMPSTTATCAPMPSATIAHAAAPISPPLGSRQATAAARLKHFEKKARLLTG